MGFNTSISGMSNSQRKLYTVNHNVSNAEREGYSRQKVNSSANIPFHVAGQGYVGTGIGIDSVERVRDLYLDKKFRTESASFGNWDMINRSLNEIEGVLRGSDEEGINVNLDEMFKSIEDLSTNPSDMSYRTAFREKAVSFTKTINETVNRLYKQQKDLNSEVKIKIKQVNDYADQIKSLNSEIFAMEVDGSNANDLRDQRDLLIDKLSEIVDIEAEETLVNIEETKDGKSIPIKKFEVRIGGMVLVDHNHTSKLKYPPTPIDNDLNPKEKLYQVEWASGGEVKIKGGELKGLLEARDGAGGAESNGIPYYIDKLDEFARVFAKQMNDIHKEGINLNKNDEVFLFTINDKTTGEIDKDDLYSKDPADNEVRIRADNISISGDILKDLKNIATIGRPLDENGDPIPGDVDKEDIENSNILIQMINARENPEFFGKNEAYQGKPEDYFTSLLSTLGTDNQQAVRMKSIQESILKNATNQKLSVSGVDLNEEMADMVKFQQIYNASAKMLTTFDQIFDTMINRLGMVGR